VLVATRVQVTVDCADPRRLVRFWASALGYRVEEPPAGFGSWTAYWRSLGVPEEELEPVPGLESGGNGEDGSDSDSIVDPDGVGPRIWFQKVPEGKAGKNRLHLDLGVSGGRGVALPTRRQRVDTEAARLVAEGATVLRVLAEPGVDHYGVVMQDPEGNEFCLH
jgi:catechol 2,3-dioxygenase-like lactoylglutathione lyase family enzyme